MSNPQKLRSVARRCEASGLLLATRILRGLRRSKGGAYEPAPDWDVPIACFHRVTSFGQGDDLPDDLPTPDWNVPPDQFRKQLTGLLDRGWHPVSLQDVLRAHRDRSDYPSRAFVVTFDDGYRNNWTEAAPILRELEVPATIFLATQFMDSEQPFPSDTWVGAGDERVPRDSWLPLSWDDCRKAANEGLIRFGCHTHTHADFRQRTLDEFRSDLVCSHDRLQQELEINSIPFAFPYGMKHLGFVTDELTEIVRETGFSCAVSLEPELASSRTTPFAWGRVVVDGSDTGRTLDLKFSRDHSRLKRRLFDMTRLLRPSSTSDS